LSLVWAGMPKTSFRKNSGALAGFCVKEIYAFEVLSSTEWQTPGMLPFIPSVFVEISDHIEIKQKVLEAYRDEMHQQPHSRSIQNLINLASVRGSSVGLESVEAFMVLRLIK
jgi:N-acetylglucosamine malate deacetylase 1